MKPLSRQKKDVLILALKMLAGEQPQASEDDIGEAFEIINWIRKRPTHSLVDVPALLSTTALEILNLDIPDSSDRGLSAVLGAKVKAASLLHAMDEERATMRRNVDTHAALLYRLCPSDLLGLLTEDFPLEKVRAELRKRLRADREAYHEVKKLS